MVTTEECAWTEDDLYSLRLDRIWHCHLICAEGLVQDDELLPKGRADVPTTKDILSLPQRLFSHVRSG